MRSCTSVLFCLLLLAVSWPVQALSPADDIIVAAAARGGPWQTDLFILNPGDETVNGTVYWLVRNQANHDPVGFDVRLLPGETAVLTDVVSTGFGFEAGAGAFRVVADGEVVVNSRILADTGSETFGQGFEGVPVAAATGAGQTTAIVGLTQISGSFRTNFYACSGADGATLTLSLVDPNGMELAQSQLTLRSYEPYLQSIGQAVGAPEFADGTLMVSVVTGSAVVGASKVDEVSTDPTTLESSVPLGPGGSVDGRYQFAIYDSEGFATGGNLVISEGQMTALSGTYSNWDKDEDADGSADCVLTFLFGLGMPVSDLADVADGVIFSDSYAVTGSGDIEWTLSLTVDDYTSLSGSISAEGSSFPSFADPIEDQTGCNGAFPSLTLIGGRVD